MNVILFTKRNERPRTLRLNRLACYLGAATAGAVLVTGAFSAGYWMGSDGRGDAVDSKVIRTWKHELAEQRRALDGARERTQAYLDALSLRMGQMQAHVMRLNALGRRLTKMAELDNGEFDFEQAPAQGGPERSAEAPDLPPEDVFQAMEELARRMDDREQQLAALETMLLHGNLQQQVHPAGRPITQGWLSSYYGKRADPFSGKPEHHSGIDFAGKLGSDVIAVAAGVVTWSGKRYGYGNLVEIDHGNGYVTRYAHNQKNLVKVGDKISKGQRIALMGTSGRSTGPHVHFEVLHDGRVVNPYKYIRAAR
ncbi:MAG: M23 family metallopeptidase [Gammaproteobacteria bacterium]|nr:M23 family metallopeptidase [Gammaproteobacteria bacterium]NIR98328.1 M23 family metallopeptidase [Gammaproteobacteria bacterium]NIT64075.1 M23 family metallopeptidase [Gammaproteobacteria bacterium]NIV21006.1 peptidoglycan DD-metalloendopeptidase family protein [Gammaproteobacteria bacterium]NIX10403.1 peptidoglycan DD-metalloendopeptidase family protein [Gammaproteobacteria bacterium]